MSYPEHDSDYGVLPDEGASAELAGADDVFDDGDPQCGGCGYPVECAGDLCGECACENDGDLY